LQIRLIAVTERTTHYLHHFTVVQINTGAKFHNTYLPGFFMLSLSCWLERQHTTKATLLSISCEKSQGISSQLNASLTQLEYCINSIDSILFTP
jgi:hypothetical protein